MKRFLALCLLGCAVLPAQQVPGATELPGTPFFIKKTWFIGGAGNWDYLTMDAAAGKLFIAHGAAVQVVDVESGAVAGMVSGLRDAHSIALDESGEVGFVSDGPANQVKVFDRSTFKVVASIPSGSSPRALVFEPQTRLLFAVCAAPRMGNTARPTGSQERTAPNAAGRAAARNGTATGSSITVIDAEKRQPLGEILMPGRLGFAGTDGHGHVYISIVDRNQIARLDAQSIGELLGRRADRAATAVAGVPQPAAGQASLIPSGSAQENAALPALDWSHESRSANSAQDRLRLFALGPGCIAPSALAVDGSHQRLFVACDEMKMEVLNADTGELVASLPTGPGTGAIGYDAGRGLIYSANGGASGSLTMIRQDVTDSYAVIQNLPTCQRARTLAVNAVTGEVYLVTDLQGMDLAQPGGIGTLKTAPVSGSFEVLVVGH
jgi:DNA-binding beta-propeller fold protein YncE